MLKKSHLVALLLLIAKNPWLRPFRNKVLAIMEKRNQVYKPRKVLSPMKITSINDYKDIHQEKDTVLVLGYFDALHRGPEFF